MSPLKPYLIRGVYDWIVDNDLTPYLLVNAEYKGTVVPQQFVDNGQIVLNLRPQAIHALSIDNDSIVFNARFGGNPMRVIVPIPAALALYARENGRGMVFDAEEADGDDTPPPSAPEPDKSSRPSLRVVK
jgi:stringent starvation protein B